MRHFVVLAVIALALACAADASSIRSRLNSVRQTPGGVVLSPARLVTPVYDNAGSETVAPAVAQSACEHPCVKEPSVVIDAEDASAGAPAEESSEEESSEDDVKLDHLVKKYQEDLESDQDELTAESGESAKKKEEDDDESDKELMALARKDASDILNEKLESSEESSKESSAAVSNSEILAKIEALAKSMEDMKNRMSVPSGGAASEGAEAQLETEQEKAKEVEESEAAAEASEKADEETKAEQEESAAEAAAEEAVEESRNEAAEASSELPKADAFDQRVVELSESTINRIVDLTAARVEKLLEGRLLPKKESSEESTSEESSSEESSSKESSEDAEAAAVKKYDASLTLEQEGSSAIAKASSKAAAASSTAAKEVEQELLKAEQELSEVAASKPRFREIRSDVESETEGW